VSLEGHLWNRLNSAWREIKDSATIAWSFATPNEASASLVAGSIGTTELTDDNVTNGKLANMAESTIKGRAAGAGTGDPTDLTATQATAILNAFTGDSGSGGVKGLVPAPAAGDAAAAKFLKADGAWTAVTSPALVPLTSGTTTDQATLDIVLTSYTTYRSIVIILTDIVAHSDDVAFWARLSTDGGSSYLDGASDYSFAMTGLNMAGGNSSSTGTDSEAQIRFTSGVATDMFSTDAGSSGYFFVEIGSRTSATLKTSVFWTGGHSNTDANGLNVTTGFGQRLAQEDSDAIRFMMSSGNITANYAVYGRV
jgi:hypothetical protein